MLEEASSSGLALEVENNFPPVEEKWSILQAVFFSSTVLTTIGVYDDVSILFIWHLEIKEKSFRIITQKLVVERIVSKLHFQFYRLGKPL